MLYVTNEYYLVLGACTISQDTIFVADDQDPLAHKLHRFGPKSSQKWPFVCVPLSAGPSAVSIWNQILIDDQKRGV